MSNVMSAAVICTTWCMPFLAIRLDAYCGVPPHLLREAANDEPSGPEAA